MFIIIIIIVIIIITRPRLDFGRLGIGGSLGDEGFHVLSYVHLGEKVTFLCHNQTRNWHHILI